MNIFHILSLTIIITAALPSTAREPVQQNLVEQALTLVDEAISSQPQMLQERQKIIDSISLTPDSPEKFHDIGLAYSGVNVDSALANYHRYIETAATPYQKNEGTILYASQLPTEGLYDEAASTLPSDPTSLPSDLKILYWRTRAANSMEASTNHPLAAKRLHYRYDAVAAWDSLANLYPTSSAHSRFAKAFTNLLKGDTVIATGELTDVLDSLPEQSPEFIAACTAIGTYFSGQPDKKSLSIYYMAKAAESEIKSVMLDGRSLSLLGTALSEYRDGEEEKASKYLEKACADAKMSGSRMRVLQSGPAMAKIAEIHRHDEARRNRLYAGIFSVLVAAIALGGWLLHMKSTQNRHQAEKIRLAMETHRAKDSYIKQLLNLCQTLIAGNQEFSKHIGRKLKAGQAQDLITEIQSGKFTKEQNDQFGEVFDTAVANIYPNFVSDINSLLQPGKHYDQPVGNRLSPELRIVAFMRFGITDSSQIARFLGLSLNTVYTYRNRAKMRAIDRDKFEENVLNLRFSS